MSIKRFGLVSPVVMWIIVLVGAFPLWLLIPHGLLYSPDSWLLVVLVLSFLNWVYLFSGGILANRDAIRSAANVQKPVTTGVYRHVRHPIYSADILLALGIVLNWPDYRLLAIVVWLSLILSIWMRMEEGVLIRRFGSAYAEYRQRTPMFIPRYFSLKRKP